MSDSNETVWVKDLKMKEVRVCEWQGIRYFAPLEQAFENHKVRKIKGRIGRYTGTYSMGLHYYALHSFGSQEVLFKLDRKTIIDRNANGKLLDEAVLLGAISIGVKSRNPKSVILSTVGYAGVSGTLNF